MQLKFVLRDYSTLAQGGVDRVFTRVSPVSLVILHHVLAIPLFVIIRLMDIQYHNNYLLFQYLHVQLKHN